MTRHALNLAALAQDDHCLRQRNILITGAASDLGRQVSIACAQRGASVLLLDRRRDELHAVYDHIRALGQAEPLLVEFDLYAQQQDFTRIAASIDQLLPSLQGLVHCAAVAARLTPMSHNNLAHWPTIHQALVLAPLLLTQHLLPSLQKAATASVVFTSLDVARQPRAYWGALAANFAALENAVKTWAIESNTTPRFNLLDPGNLKTTLRKKYYPAEDATPLRAPDDPTLLAHYIYLLSEHSQHLTGQLLRVSDAVSGQ